MALIKCKECGKEISDKIEICVHCGCPLSKVIFNTSDTFIGIAGRYFITDEDGNLVAKMKAGEKFEMNIDKDTTFYVGRKAAVWQKGIEVKTFVDRTNKFLIDMGGSLGMKVVVSKIN